MCRGQWNILDGEVKRPDWVPANLESPRRGGPPCETGSLDRPQPSDPVKATLTTEAFSPISLSNHEYIFRHNDTSLLVVGY